LKQIIISEATAAAYLTRYSHEVCRAKTLFNSTR